MFRVCALDGRARKSRHVDLDLKNAGAGVVVATADGGVSEGGGVVIDIAACLMEREGIEPNRII